MTALKRIARAKKKIDAATVERDAAIAEAVAAGVSLRQVGEAAGVSHEQARTIAARVAA